SGSVRRRWSFAGPGTATADAAAASGTATVSAPGTWVATLEVTDARGDLTCSTTSSGSVDVWNALAIAPRLVPTCGLEFGYDVSIDGGSPGARYAWIFT